MDRAENFIGHATHWIVPSKSTAVCDVSLLQRQFGKSILVAMKSAIKSSFFVALPWTLKYCFLLIVILTVMPTLFISLLVIMQHLLSSICYNRSQQVPQFWWSFLHVSYLFQSRMSIGRHMLLTLLTVLSLATENCGRQSQASLK